MKYILLLALVLTFSTELIEAITNVQREEGFVNGITSSNTVVALEEFDGQLYVDTYFSIQGDTNIGNQFTFFGISEANLNNITSTQIVSLNASTTTITDIFFQSQPVPVKINDIRAVGTNVRIYEVFIDGGELVKYRGTSDFHDSHAFDNGKRHPCELYFDTIGHNTCADGTNVGGAGIHDMITAKSNGVRGETFQPDTVVLKFDTHGNILAVDEADKAFAKWHYYYDYHNGAIKDGYDTGYFFKDAVAACANPDAVPSAFIDRLNEVGYGYFGITFSLHGSPGDSDDRFTGSFNFVKCFVPIFNIGYFGIMDGALLNPCFGLQMCNVPFVQSVIQSGECLNEGYFQVGQDQFGRFHCSADQSAAPHVGGVTPWIAVMTPDTNSCLNTSSCNTQFAGCLYNSSCPTANLGIVPSSSNLLNTGGKTYYTTALWLQGSKSPLVESQVDIQTDFDYHFQEMLSIYLHGLSYDTGAYNQLGSLDFHSTYTHIIPTTVNYDGTTDAKMTVTAGPTAQTFIDVTVTSAYSSSGSDVNWINPVYYNWSIDTPFTMTLLTTFQFTQEIIPGEATINSCAVLDYEDGPIVVNMDVQITQVGSISCWGIYSYGNGNVISMDPTSYTFMVLGHEQFPIPNPTGQVTAVNTTCLGSNQLVTCNFTRVASAFLFGVNSGNRHNISDFLGGFLPPEDSGWGGWDGIGSFITDAFKLPGQITCALTGGLIGCDGGGGLGGFIGGIISFLINAGIVILIVVAVYYVGKFLLNSFNESQQDAKKKKQREEERQEDREDARERGKKSAPSTKRSNSKKTQPREVPIPSFYLTQDSL